MLTGWRSRRLELLPKCRAADALEQGKRDEADSLVQEAAALLKVRQRLFAA